MTVYSDNPRLIAFEVLLRVAEGAYSDRALDAALKRAELDDRDRRLATELIYGSLRLQGRIDFALQQFYDKQLKRLQPEILCLLRLGAYQLLELDRVPAHAAVNASVEMARDQGFDKATGLINAVLRSLERGKQQINWPPPEKVKPYLQHVCGLPVWLCKEIMHRLPNVEARALGDSLCQIPPLSLRANSLKIDREALLEALKEAGHSATPCTYAPEALTIEMRGDNPLPGDAEGWYQIQDEASVLIGHLLDVAPGQRILDCCAAPGGKTTHLAALSDNRAEIVALEKYPQRVELITNGAQRLGCTSIEAHQCDLTESPEFLEPKSFDRVLLDAPCSGLGVLRRNPEGRWNKSSVNLRELAELQHQLLNNAAKLVKPGGKLLYSVCTFSHLETDNVIASFLKENKAFTQEKLQESLPQWGELFTDQGALRSYPYKHGGMDAFFAVRLQRKADM
jgi:16S rRNA (cytosine967-C5)-methyltransferase